MERRFRLGGLYRTSFMRHTARIILVAAVMTLIDVAAADSLGEGIAAYQRQDYAAALRIIRRYAEQGDEAAQGVLGIMFENGHGVPHDDGEAAKRLRLAANQNFAIAQTDGSHFVAFTSTVGVCLKDHVERARWYRKAADQDYRQAQIYLGTLYDIGVGVPRDYVLAYMWYNLAAAQGSRDAEQSRAAVSDHMTPDQIAEAQRLTREWKPMREWMPTK